MELTIRKIFFYFKSVSLKQFDEENYFCRSRRTDALVLQRIKIINLFFTLASLDPSVLSQDRSLLQEWQDIFCDDLRPNVKIYYVFVFSFFPNSIFFNCLKKNLYSNFRRDDVEALAFVYQPLNVTKDANADSILYLSHLLIVPHLQNFGYTFDLFAAPKQEIY